MKISIRQSEGYDWQVQDTWAVEQGREQAALDLGGHNEKIQTAQLNKKSRKGSVIWEQAE